MRRVVLVGGGGHASDVLGVVEALVAAGEPIEVVGILADSPVAPERFIGRDVAHLGPVAALADLDADYVLAIGYPDVRRRVLDQVSPLGRTAATLVHPAAVVGAGALLGPGVVVFDGAHLSAMCRIGAHSCVSYHADVGHDSVVGDCCTVMPGASISGEVVVGDDVLIGAHSVVLEQLTVGDRARVGAGSTVLRNVPADVTVFGTPARVVAR